VKPVFFYGHSGRNGVKIPGRHLSEIFEPFFSTKPTTGTGLGLGVVKRLVKLYGGTIEVESEVGEGARFVVTLPYHIEPQTHTDVYLATDTHRHTRTNDKR